jgi:hypothetical protein
MATDYDKGKVTDRERKAADRQNELASYTDKTLTTAADYNKGSSSALESWNEKNQRDIAKKNAANTAKIAERNTQATANQLNRQLATYDLANKQNKALRDVENVQTRRKAESERFESFRNLINAATGLFGSMGPTTMNSSTTQNTGTMLRTRNDADNSVHWQNLQDNLNSIQNAYDESRNQNQIAKRDAAINAIKAISDIRSGLAADLNNIQTDYWANLGNLRGDLYANLSNIASDLYTNRRNASADRGANLNNINPNLYQAPDENIPLEPYAQLTGNGSSGYKVNDDIFKGNSDIYPGTNPSKKINEYSQAAQDKLAGIQQNSPTLLPYLMPANAEQNVLRYRNRLGGNDYFSNLLNRFNNR